MTNNRFVYTTGIYFALMFSGMAAFAQESQLSKDFKNPPPSARPRAWWHWANSNVTKEGITKDFEWMKRVGIQGMQLGDVASGGGQTVEKKLVFGTPEWLDAVKHAASEADRLGLEMAMFTSGGWSLTGGPWVKPAMAMKKLVWSETLVQGGKKLAVKIPQPPSAEGAGPLLKNGNRPNGFYKDYAVIAYRTPADELAAAISATATTYKSAINASTLMDDDLSTGVSIPANPATKKAWLTLTYGQPFKAKAVMIAGRTGIPFGRVQASTDGVNYKTLVTTPGKSGYRGGSIRTYAFPEVTAKYFRFEITNVPVRPGDVISEATTLVDTAYRLTELRLIPGARVNRWEDKAGFNFLFEYDGTATPVYPSPAIIKKQDVIDLTAYMAADGTLNWNAPQGNWTIMRFGYALTGAKNRPAVPAALGYEVDKMSKEYVTEYMQGYTSPLVKALGPLYGKSMQYMVMDSWEAGIQNWTDKMPDEFSKRRSYALLPYLPVLTGRVVENGEVSDRFLWDFRRTLVDLIAENHYGTVTNYLNQQGVKTYSEAGGVSLESIEDALLNKKYVDIPMGEFWVRDLHPSSMYYEDVRGAASASHVYGKGLVAAEAFTGGNYEAPARLKSIADYWFTQGVNRLVFHTSAHQPLDTKPGNTMVGTHINRNITWAELAKPFMTYLSRNSYMLQRGLYKADIVYLLNEGAPSTMPFWGPGVQPATPEGYAFDYINADAFLSRVTIGPNGKLVLPDGLTYSILVLPQTQEMSLPVARKVKQLIAAGAIVVGPKPVKAPGLTAFPMADDELSEIGNEVWGDVNGASRTVQAYGKGKVYWNQPLQKVLLDAGIPPDVDDHRSISEVSFIHRIDGDTDIYLLVNRTDEPQNLDVKFRVTGKQPELWHADNGTAEPASYRITEKGTLVNLQLDANESVYVVFAKKAQQPLLNVKARTEMPLAEISGPWQLTFPQGWGAPAAAMQVDSLKPWSSNADAGIKYFSGTATYTKTIDVKKDWLKKGTVWLDLGKVGDIAVVAVNGGRADTLWHSPYRANVTKQLKAGKNSIEVKVTNQWTNRIAGDATLPADQKILTPGPPPFGGNRPGVAILPASGLLGPVKLVSKEEQP